MLLPSANSVCAGIDSSDLGSDVYQVSVQTSETFVAMVNVSDSSLYGEWQLSLTSFGSYSIRITAVSDLDFTYTLYRLDTTSNFGFVSFEGNPLEGDPCWVIIHAATFNFITYSDFSPWFGNHTK